MPIQAGEKLPDTKITIMQDGSPTPTTLAEQIGDATAVVFAVPGAFTPTCSAKHVPGFVEQADALQSKGVEKVICVSVNDVFVMHAWGQDQQVGDAVTMAADGNGELARALGMEMDATGFGMGERSKRYAMITDGDTVRQVYVEAPGEFRVSSAEYILEQL